MKKVLLPLIALALVLGLALVPSLAFFGLPAGLVLAQEDDPEVCLDQIGAGRGATTTLPFPYDYQWMAVFSMNVSGEFYDGWCIDPEKPISEGDCFNATVSAAPRETPWCEIAYIMTNYSATSDNESAAIQLAIWKYLLGGRGSINVTDAPSLEARALAIYDDAQGKSVCGPGLGLTLERDGEATVVGEIASQKFSATVTDSGCLEGMAIEFSTDKGSFAPPNGVPVTSVTELTDGDGKASVMLYWDASLGSPGATVTAHTEGAWPVIIQPEQEDIQPTVISKPCQLTKEITPPPPPPGVPTMNHWGIVAIIALFAGFLVSTVRRRQLAHRDLG